MSLRSGKDCVVKLGAVTVVGMGTWSIDGITADQMDASALGDDWKTFKFGMKDGGQVTFSGLCDPDDVTGQDVLKAANANNTDITDIRFYADDSSYFAPNATTGYLTPANTTGNDTLKSHVNVTSFSLSADKSDLMKTSFTCKVSGSMAYI